MSKSDILELDELVKQMENETKERTQAFVQREKERMIRFCQRRKEEFEELGDAGKKGEADIFIEAVKQIPEDITAEEVPETMRTFLDLLGFVPNDYKQKIIDYTQDIERNRDPLYRSLRRNQMYEEIQKWKNDS